MIYQNVELHNIEEVRTVRPHGGVRLQRVPEPVRRCLNEHAQQRALQPSCAEIRFKFDGDSAIVRLSSDSATAVVPMQGDFQVRHSIVVGQDEMSIEVKRSDRMDMLAGGYRGQCVFSPDVFRLVLGGRENQALFFHGAEGENVRPPEPEDLPKLRYLAYGTSITQLYSASKADLCFAAQAAWRLRADLINLGFAASAYCEPEMADYIARRTDWDFATLSLSINMVGESFTIDDFRERVTYMVNTVAGANTARPVFCITLFPSFYDIAPGYRTSPAPIEEYRAVLREAVADCPHPNVHLLEGPELLNDIRGLTDDLIHPAENGMIIMGECLARAVQEWL